MRRLAAASAPEPAFATRSRVAGRPAAAAMPSRLTTSGLPVLRVRTAVAVAAATGAVAVGHASEARVTRAAPAVRAAMTLLAV